MTVPLAPPTTVDAPKAAVDDEATRLNPQRTATDDEATRLNPKAPPVKRRAAFVATPQRGRPPFRLLLLAAGVVALLLLGLWRDEHAAPDARPLKHGHDDNRGVLDRLFNW